MSKYAVTAGVQDSPVKTVLYGPEGIGKSTFASHFPNPVFIDTEGGTKRLNVARLPQPTSWAMLLDEVAEVRKGSIPCGTLVIDTADWAERLCIQAVCAKAKAFLTDAKSQNFAMKDGEILGFDDYVKAFKESDPSAILPDGGMARFSASATGAPGQPANTHEAANAAFRAAFGQKG